MTEKKPRGRPRVNPPKQKKNPEERYGPRPHSWLSGPDEYKHSMYVPWMRAKAQANYRKEQWNLTFEEFYQLWKNHWDKRGRGADDFCMTRCDSSMPWSLENITIMTRHEHLQTKGQMQGFNRMEVKVVKEKKSYYTPLTPEEKEKRKAARRAQKSKEPKDAKQETLAEKFYGKNFRF